MNQKELFPIFPPSCILTDKVLLIIPSEFKRLKGRSINDCHIFILISEGCLILQIDGKPYEMKAYSFLDLLEGGTIRIVDTSPDLKAYCLLPNFKFASESLKNLKPGPNNYFLDRLHYPILHFSQEENDIIERQMKLFENNLCNQGHYYREELARVYFKSFMLELGNIMHTHNEDLNNISATINRRDIIIMDFMQLVWKYFQTEHNINFYAEKLCISTKHLSRIVKEMVNKTPHEIICDEILSYAMTLLEDDKIPVGQIAETLHFSDQAAFCKFFKKQMKVSPMIYRKRFSA